MAVLGSVRGAGVGAAVLSALLTESRRLGAREVMLHAQADAADFYRRQGFQPRGPRFEEAGIEHQEMVLV
jgi:predicted GNAT family N-acyltransferase